jgi:hypothetical protein
MLKHLSPSVDGRMRPVKATLTLALLVSSLAGCGNSDGVSRAFGLTRDAPDEFEVTTRAPLSMPPDYTLRPPQPGATRPQEQSQRRQAEATLAPQVELAPDPNSGATGRTASNLSGGQQALVDAAGPAAPADIRRKLGSEAALDDRGSSFTDKLLFWRPTPLPGVVVDPQKEAQRLRENAALGRSVEAGDTPIIQRKKDTLFDSLF